VKEVKQEGSHLIRLELCQLVERLFWHFWLYHTESGLITLYIKFESSHVAGDHGSIVAGYQAVHVRGPQY
jgi:hypothetical protein